MSVKSIPLCLQKWAGYCADCGCEFTCENVDIYTVTPDGTIGARVECPRCYSSVELSKIEAD
jgi:hypothetical protein